MIQNNEIVSPLIDTSSSQASLNLFSSNSVIGASLLDAASNNGNNGGNDLSSSFSKLNTENIAQMINQAQLLNLNGDASKLVVAPSTATSIIGHPINNNNNNAINISSAQSLTTTNATKSMSNNFPRQNKFNSNYNMNYGNNQSFKNFNNISNNNNNNNNNRNHMPFKNIRPPLNQAHQSLMSMNFNFPHTMTPPMALNPNVNHTNSPNVYMPFGNANVGSTFNHPNSFFMHQGNAPSPPIQTPPSYFYNTNSFNNNKHYKSYLQAKKAEVTSFEFFVYFKALRFSNISVSKISGLIN